MLIHALCKGLRRTRAVVVPAVGLLGRLTLRRRIDRRARAATKQASDGVAEAVSDGGSYGDTAIYTRRRESVQSLEIFLGKRKERKGETAYAAVVAIWPKSPGL